MPGLNPQRQRQDNGAKLSSRPPTRIQSRPTRVASNPPLRRSCRQAHAYAHTTLSEVVYHLRPLSCGAQRRSDSTSVESIVESIAEKAESPSAAAVLTESGADSVSVVGVNIVDELARAPHSTTVATKARGIPQHEQHVTSQTLDSRLGPQRADGHRPAASSAHHSPADTKPVTPIRPHGSEPAAHRPETATASEPTCRSEIHR